MYIYFVLAVVTAAPLVILFTEHGVFLKTKIKLKLKHPGGSKVMILSFD